MSRATLIVDGRTELDDDLLEWHKRPPALLADMIKPGQKPQPYLAAAAMALAEATIKNTAIHIAVTTTATGWTMTVNHTAAHLEGASSCQTGPP